MQNCELPDRDSLVITDLGEIDHVHLIRAGNIADAIPLLDYALPDGKRLTSNRIFDNFPSFHHLKLFLGCQCNMFRRSQYNYDLVDERPSKPAPTYEELRESFKGSAEKSDARIFEYWHDYIKKGKLPSYEWVFANIFEEKKEKDIFGFSRSFDFLHGGRDHYEHIHKPCVELDIFQFYSEEFIEHLTESIKRWNAKKIIEIGAGDGYLSGFLKERGIDIIATDNHSRPFIEHQEHVEKLNHKEALEKYNPDLVVMNWEENQDTVSIDVLEYSSVKYLVWIGDGFNSCNGHGDLGYFDSYRTYNPYCLARSDFWDSKRVLTHTDVHIIYPTKNENNDPYYYNSDDNGEPLSFLF